MLGGMGTKPSAIVEKKLSIISFHAFVGISGMGGMKESMGRIGGMDMVVRLYTTAGFFLPTYLGK